MRPKTRTARGGPGRFGDVGSEAARSGGEPSSGLSDAGLRTAGPRLLGLAWIGLVALCACERRTDNLLLVTVDTLRADAVGAYGSEQPTPALDRFAGRSVVYERAFSTAPFTGPAHASILSARHPSKHGVIFNGHRVAGEAGADSVFLSEHLRDAGYRTGAVVSAEPVTREFGFARGFDSFEQDCPRVPGDVGADGECVVGSARKFMEEHRGEPFFLWVHLFDPHYPYAGPGWLWRERGLDAEKHQFDEPLSNGGTPPAKLRAAYLADVAQADGYFGRLMEVLDGLGLTGRTVVAVVADHGEHLGEHESFGHHGLRDEVLHVPLMIAAPGLAARRDPRLTSTIDIAPTVLELLGLPPLSSAQGRSLSSASASRPVVFSEWRHFNIVSGGNVWPGAFQFGMRTEGHKLIQDRLFPEESLVFDLSDDPGEERSLFVEKPALSAKLQGQLQRHVSRDLDAEHVRRTRLPFDEETLGKLRALGYVE